eukprot:CAMPEP_0194136104 /NCGR_PEP_ID=MMETSP0152-20130528/6130_1 /TAXON_ID=1049557 /ORGANISM="Thalassiothrix antarctica, Strain L6-D1" /LENGTH=134 /DNA_ID=CAMNT_0038832617 /DNA_START=31 /DNA_END=436 /DNA_ORIENTATION=-
MLPLSLLRAAVGSPLLVELKGGDTYNGRLLSCDAWMNMNLREVICTSRDGDRFWKLPSCYIRGSAVKYLRLPPDLLVRAAEIEEKEQALRAGYGGAEEDVVAVRAEEDVVVLEGEVEVEGEGKLVGGILEGEAG